MKSVVRLTLACILLFTVAAPAGAGAILPGFNGSALGGNDDGSTGLVPIGFTLNFYAVSGATQLYVNNNGNVTFTGPLSTFTPFGLLTSSLAIIAPFFADVDTRGGGELVTYGAGTFGGRTAFGVNWGSAGGAGVLYYQAPHPVPTNANNFQLVIVDRSDTGAGNFDFMFNYDRIQWEAGEASESDAAGCGGSSARVGWTDGGIHDFELVGSGVHGAFIDSGTCGPLGPNALITHSLNSNTLGRYIFEVREGSVRDVPGTLPEPSTLFLLGGGLAMLAARVRARRNAAK